MSCEDGRPEETRAHFVPHLDCRPGSEWVGVGGKWTGSSHSNRRVLETTESNKELQIKSEKREKRLPEIKKRPTDRRNGRLFVILGFFRLRRSFASESTAERNRKEGGRAKSDRRPQIPKEIGAGGRFVAFWSARRRRPLASSRSSLEDGRPERSEQNGRPFPSMSAVDGGLLHALGFAGCKNARAGAFHGHSLVCSRFDAIRGEPADSTDFRPVCGG